MPTAGVGTRATCTRRAAAAIHMNTNGNERRTEMARKAMSDVTVAAVRFVWAGSKRWSRITYGTSPHTIASPASTTSTRQSSLASLKERTVCTTFIISTSVLRSGSEDIGRWDALTNAAPHDPVTPVWTGIRFDRLT